MFFGTIINPLLKLVLVAAVLVGVYLSGYYNSRTASAAKYNKELVIATERNAEISKQLEADAEVFAKNLKDLNNESQAKINALKRSVATGAVRLSIPTTSSPSTCEAPEATVRVVTETRTEIDPATAQALIDITNSGDKAIRQLNELIDFYNNLEK
jgi:hypothetical protein